VTAAHYRLVFPDERPPEDGDADVRITDGTVVLVLGDGDVLRVPFGLVISSGPADGFALRIALAGGAQIELSRLGRMRTQLLAELRDGQAGATAAASAAAGQPEVFTATGRDGPVEVRVYDDALLITGATGSERISFSFITGVALTSYVVTVTVAGGEPVTVPGLGRRAGELADLLAARRADARVRTASFLGELLPGLDPMMLRQMATLLRDGVAVPTAALDAIAPGTAGALLQKATVPARREAVAELSRRTALAIGFRQIGSVRRAAVGTSAWHDPAAVPHIGAHEPPGGSFGPGALGMLAAETITAGAGPGGLGGFPGGTYPFPGLFPGGSYLFSGGYAGFRMAGATIDHGQQHSMTPRPDVTRGRLSAGRRGAGRGGAGRVAGRPDRARRRLVRPARFPARQFFRIRVTGRRSLMTDPAHGIRASDADRDEAAGTLADATADGRISLTEHHARLDALYAAVTEDEVAAVTADLPASLPAGLAGPAGRGALLRMLGPYRCLVIGGKARRAGRFRVGRFCTVAVVFGGLELDLRAAQLSRDALTLTVWSLLSPVTVTVPAHARVLDQVLVIGRRRTVPDDDGAAGSPVIRLRGISLGGSFHVPRM
jgi:hypothetical protein